MGSPLGAKCLEHTPNGPFGFLRVESGKIVRAYSITGLWLMGYMGTWGYIEGYIVGFSRK